MRAILVAALVAASAAVLPGTATASPGLDSFSSTAGTAWWTDPASGRTVVSLDDTVSGTVAFSLTRAVSRTGGTVIREPGVLRKHTAGADPFYGSATGRCLIGFNARALPDYYFLTSAHCAGPVGQTIYADAARTVVLGTVSTKNTTLDYALIRYTNAAIRKPSSVNLYNGSHTQIRSFGNGTLGQLVTRSGPSGVRTGQITALNVTVNYADGTVFGLIRTSVCSQPGDSGGPLFAGTVGIGLTSGGSGSCATGGVTYFASAYRAATAYGVSAYLTPLSIVGAHDPALG